MSAPTKQRSAADLLADAHARLLAAGIVMLEAIVAAQNEGLPCESTLRFVHRQILAVADRQVDVLEEIGPTKAPRFEVLPGGLSSPGMCGECGRIGDHQPRCPEVAS